MGPDLADHERDELRAAMLDLHYVDARRKFAVAMRDALNDVASWIAVDSFLGGGKVGDGATANNRNEDWAEFRAVATVINMCAELAHAAVAMASEGKTYAVASSVRQMIECEYLLVWFADDLDNAARWRESTPGEIRRHFAPGQMRRLTGFDDHEYWRHCDNGGHPNPTGQRLLEMLDTPQQQWKYVAAEVQIDLGLHLARCWRVTDRLLAAHHARYTAVRSHVRDQAVEAFAAWCRSDPLVEPFADE